VGDAGVVAVVQPGGPQLPAATSDALLIEDLAADVGGGLGNVRADDLALPFLTILQGQSPQVLNGVEGARVGAMFNTVTSRSYKSVRLVPCAFIKAWVEWRDRDKGGGLVKQHDTDELMATTTRNDKNIDVLPNGNHLIPTAYHYCLMLDEDGVPHRVVLGMKSTALKKSRRWLSTIADLKLPIGPGGGYATPPSWAHVYEVTTVLERNKQGKEYFNWSIGDPKPLTSRDLYLAGRGFNQEVLAGGVTVTPPEELSEPEVEARANSFDADEKVPF